MHRRVQCLEFPGTAERDGGVGRKEFRDSFGVVWPGFGLLAATAAALWGLNARLFLTRQHAIERGGLSLLGSRRAEQLRAGAWATMATALLIAAIVVGSRNLQNFDPALVIYTFAVIFAT